MFVFFRNLQYLSNILNLIKKKKFCEIWIKIHHYFVRLIKQLYILKYVFWIYIFKWIWSKYYSDYVTCMFPLDVGIAIFRMKTKDDLAQNSTYLLALGLENIGWENYFWFFLSPSVFTIIQWQRRCVQSSVMDAVLVRTSVTAATVNVQEAVSDPKTQTASYVSSSCMV